ncbi:MAG TPA: peptide chain release factor N(5)-glutamine methyltransferase [Acidisarcina sp.]|nr:peptide chain release factor N(5)-glutamine methyltransferase [Acidisarcina sp.]
MATIRQMLAEAAQRLASIQDASAARQDAQLLMMHVLSCDRASLLAYPERVLTAEEERAYRECLSRRETSEPVQYILGRAEFYGLPFEVDGRVLIPRPETEHLVESLLHRVPKDKPLSIVDVGTGSGAIAIALAFHLPMAHLTALDISSEALQLAQSNAALNGVADRVRFLSSDLLDAVAHEHFDAVVSNPPYVAEQDRATLSSQVRDFEPASALFAGSTGLDIYRRLIPQAHAVLKPHGWLLMEIGYGQQPAIEALLADWSDVTFVPDLQGIPRVACARRRT